MARPRPPNNLEAPGLPQLLDHAVLQRARAPATHAPDTEPGKRDTDAGTRTDGRKVLPSLSEVGAGCGKAARPDLCGGAGATRFPTAMLSWNVIFHGTMGDVGRRLAEIWRVLKPGGLYQGTMLSKRDAQFGRGRPVAPDPFIRGSGPKAHPHYYCDFAGLAALFAGFELLSLTQEEQRRPGSWHWHIVAERR